MRSARMRSACGKTSTNKNGRDSSRVMREDRLQTREVLLQGLRRLHHILRITRRGRVRRHPGDFVILAAHHDRDVRSLRQLRYAGRLTRRCLRQSAGGRHNPMMLWTAALSGNAAWDSVAARPRGRQGSHRPRRGLQASTPGTRHRRQG